jgi:hypothetical protein
MSERGWVDLEEMNRIGIAIRGGASKQGYFDYKADYYKREGYDRQAGEKFWDEMVKWHADNPLKEGQYYAPISEL